MDACNEVNQQRLRMLIKGNPSLANDNDKDSNNIELMLYISYSLKTLKLILMIGNISFFLGIFWLIFCELSEDSTEYFGMEV